MPPLPPPAPSGGWQAPAPAPAAKGVATFDLPPPAALPPAPPPRAPQPLPLAPAPAPVPMKKLTFHKAASPTMPAVQPPAGDVRPVQAIQPPLRPPGGAGLSFDQMDYLLQLLPAPFERLIRIQNEDSLHEQLRQEAREKTPPERAVFPDEPPTTDKPYMARVFPPAVELAEPAYVNYNRLYFEDLNSERYGWELGFAQPFVSAGLFFADAALMPYHFASRPCDCIESSAGYCLPGDPVPYLLYPPNLSVTGAVGEAGAILGLIAIFP